ncbi:hypothetical protein UA08_01085 [Talaromyces atroroseus]|uniref:Aminotransferase class I/classII large domain-containing protein n=1 Tax=Talaromyces atroroseus TaxID=1441469 RepID=A0A225BAF6_TALAT|nr:hypothetical protein UA08_01085 [Talaromyces atroroseus]OKL64366.1 hypothetical protein UA08_01085 [Talaromyces atroroseus]
MTQDPIPIDLFRGWPNPTLLPVDSLAQSAATVLSTPALYQPGLQYGPDEGYAPLRQHVATWLSSFYPPTAAKRTGPISSARLCITGGASQNLACVLQVYTDAAYTRNIWLVAPTYYLACRIFDDAGFMNRLRGVPEDAEGIDLEFLEQRLHEAEQDVRITKPLHTLPRPWSKIYKHVIYLTPTFANPSTKVVSLRRREELVRLARRFDALIIADDVYDFLQWPSDPSVPEQEYDSETALLPRIVDIDGYLDGGPIDEWGNAMSNGSFSKLIGPGMRVGWVEGTEKFSYGISQTGSTRSGGAPSQLASTFVDQILHSGSLQRHIKSELIPSYRARYNRMMGAINEHLLPLGFKVPANTQPTAGGFFVWLDLPESLTGDLLAERALAEGNLRIGSGSLFQIEGDGTEYRRTFGRSIRLCFAWERVEVLDEGVRRLADIYLSKFFNLKTTTL